MMPNGKFDEKGGLELMRALNPGVDDDHALLEALQIHIDKSLHPQDIGDEASEPDSTAGTTSDTDDRGLADDEAGRIESETGIREESREIREKRETRRLRLSHTFTIDGSRDKDGDFEETRGVKEKGPNNKEIPVLVLNELPLLLYSAPPPFYATPSRKGTRPTNLLPVKSQEEGRRGEESEARGVDGEYRNWLTSVSCGMAGQRVRAAHTRRLDVPCDVESAPLQIGSMTPLQMSASPHNNCQTEEERQCETEAQTLMKQTSLPLTPLNLSQSQTALSIHVPFSQSPFDGPAGPSDRAAKPSTFAASDPAAFVDQNSSRDRVGVRVEIRALGETYDLAAGSSLLLMTDSAPPRSQDLCDGQSVSVAGEGLMLTQELRLAAARDHIRLGGAEASQTISVFLQYLEPDT